MAGKITEYTETTSLADGDFFEIIDISQGAGTDDRNRKMLASNVKLYMNSDREVPIPLMQEVPNDTVAYPDVKTLSTTITKKISGAVLPDVTLSTYNYKTQFAIPPNLASSPGCRIELVIMGTVAATSKGVVLTVKHRDVATTESLDFTTWTESIAKDRVPITDAINTQTVYSANFATQPVAGDMVYIQIERDPADSTTETTGDDYAGDIMIVSACLWIKRSV